LQIALLSRDLSLDLLNFDTVFLLCLLYIAQIFLFLPLIGLLLFGQAVMQLLELPDDVGLVLGPLVNLLKVVVQDLTLGVLQHVPLLQQLTLLLPRRHWGWLGSQRRDLVKLIQEVVSNVAIVATVQERTALQVLQRLSFLLSLLKGLLSEVLAVLVP
jgi:hypothetical protein